MEFLLYFQNESALCNKNVLIRGNLLAKSIETPSARVWTVNGKIWEPSKWLLNNTSQYVDLKSIEHENIVVKNLYVTDEDSPLQSKLVKVQT